MGDMGGATTRMWAVFGCMIFLLIAIAALASTLIIMAVDNDADVEATLARLSTFAPENGLSDSECYRVFATPDICNTYCPGQGIAASATTGRFWGDICFHGELVTWKFEFKGGLAGQIPTSLWITTLTDTQAQGGIATFGTAPVHFTELDVLSLGGNLVGSLEGTKVVTAEEGFRLRAGPGRTYIFAKDATDGVTNFCDFAAVIDEGSRKLDFLHILP